MKYAIAGCLGALMMLATNAMANTIVFQDNFDSEPGGTQLNYNSFANWTVSNGTVDLIGMPNIWGISCVGGVGKCVDLDGSTSNAGIMTSTTLVLTPGTYELSFDYSGNQRDGGIDVFLSALDGSFSHVFLTKANDPFKTFVADINIGTTENAKIIFSNFGGDNVGAILDNVKLVQLPEPATWSLMILGFGLLATARRRQFARAAV